MKPVFETDWQRWGIGFVVGRLDKRGGGWEAIAAIGPFTIGIERLR